MTLVDTSVWIKHLRHPVEELITLLKNRRVLIHSAVIGELACGSIPKRTQFLADVALLSKAQEADPEEVFRFIETHKLYGKGLGWVDMQLIASALLSNVSLFTYDKKLSDTFFKIMPRA